MRMSTAIVIPPTTELLLKSICTPVCRQRKEWLILSPRSTCACAKRCLPVGPALNCRVNLTYVMYGRNYVNDQSLGG